MEHDKGCRNSSCFKFYLSLRNVYLFPTLQVNKLTNSERVLAFHNFTCCCSTNNSKAAQYSLGCVLCSMELVVCGGINIRIH